MFPSNLLKFTKWQPLLALGFLKFLRNVLDVKFFQKLTVVFLVKEVAHLFYQIYYSYYRGIFEQSCDVHRTASPFIAPLALLTMVILLNPFGAIGDFSRLESNIDTKYSAPKGLNVAKCLILGN